MTMMSRLLSHGCVRAHRDRRIERAYPGKRRFRTGVPQHRLTVRVTKGHLSARDFHWGKWTFHEFVAPEKLVLISSLSDAAGGITRHQMSPTWPLETRHCIENLPLQSSKKNVGQRHPRGFLDMNVKKFIRYRSLEPLIAVPTRLVNAHVFIHTYCQGFGHLCLRVVLCGTGIDSAYDFRIFCSFELAIPKPSPSS